MFLPTDPTHWYPEQHTGYRTSNSLAPGQIVIWERSAYRVIETKERGQVDWPDTFRDRWVEYGMPDPVTWSGRPFVVALRVEREPDAKPLHLLGPADHLWLTLPEHFSICRICGEIPPCGHVHNERVMAVASKRMDADMALMPGLCHGCRSPITKRQKTIVFEGENLIRPDFGDGTAIFHLKASCRWAAERYDARWAAAVEGRRRKLYCDGLRRHHYDGTMDCTEGALCPGKVNHKSGEWHTLDGTASRYTAGCWCVSGDLAGRLAAADKDGAS